MKWILRAAQHGAAQALAQSAALVTGILIVRALAKEEYAQYSVATMLIPAIASLADSGIAAVLLAEGQAARGDRSALSRLYYTALRQRWRLGIPVISVGLVWLAILLSGAGGGALEITIIVAVIGVILAPTLTVSVLQTFHRIHLSIRVLRRAILVPALARLALTALLYFTGTLSIWSLLAVTLVTTAGTVWYLRWAADVDSDAPRRDPALVGSFVTAIRRSLPMTIAAVVTSQALVGIIALKGSPDVLADYSAVSRFGLAFSLFAPIVADIVAPNIARLPPIRGRVARHVLSALLGCVAVVVAGAALVWLLRHCLLGLLGPKYDSLEWPLVLVFVGYGVTFVGHAMGAVTQSRNWLIGSWAYIPIAVVWFGFVIFIPTVPNAETAALLLISQSGILVATQLVRAGIGIVRTPARAGD